MNRGSAARWAAVLLLTGTAAAQAPPAVWIDVPFVHQPREGCGAASLAMVMEFWARQRALDAGPEADVAEIQQALYSKKEHGISAAAMQQYLRQHGFQAFAINGSWADLEQHLGKGRPLIVALRPQGQTELHYVVIDGIDPDHGLITMNDPAERKLLRQERAGFEQDWKATRNWMLLAVPAPQ